ncbi:MAG: cadherin-like domain-containing protein [Leptolyngbyaceae cyanobacterium bins.349]|nr:cadherin-like domain-containing protein [Leptolyngbyaceae cyanobacterium bins.349]
MAINFTGSYSQNFDSLALSGTSNPWTNTVTLPGWYLFRQPAPGTAISTYIADVGTSNSGSFYSYGATGSSDRAFGGLGSGGAYFGSPATGAIAGWIAFGATNTTGATINSLNLAFNGEQWRNGGNTSAQPMMLEYGFGPTFETVTTWTAPGGNFDWSSPITGSTAGAVDGNAAGLASNRGGILPATWANGDTLWIRWVERNDSGNDHGLAIDNFSLSSSVTPPPTGSVVTIAAIDATAAEANQDPGTFRISRTGDTTNALTVNYTLTSPGPGQATTGVDYTPTLTGTALIPAGQAFVDITITPLDDSDVEGNETATLALANSATGDYTLGTTISASIAIADNDIAPATRIRDIQGTSHRSPLVGQAVSGVAGIVTAVATNGFYLQDPNPDTDDRTSEGIFVFTSSAPTVAVGDSVRVNGTVSEFRPGNNANNLTITQITSPAIAVLSSGNALPAAVILGNGGRTIPTQVIDNDTTGNIETGATTFDPAQDGIDFYESLEGMRVQINNPIATSLTASFSSSEEIWVLADNGANATSRTARGGSLITASDFNPERIQIDDLINGAIALPAVDVGAQLSTITGVVSYDFNNYEVLVPTAPTIVQASPLQREVTNLTGTANQLTVATFNVENLDPGDGATKFNALATAIVNNLRSPDIINLEEIQDNNGPTNDSVVDASTTFQLLIDAIAAAGGPTYQFRQINPVDDTNGGEPGGNIRVGFLFNPSRVTFVDRPGGSATTGTTVTDLGTNGTPDLSASPGLIDPTNPAFNASRKPLVGEFVFNGQTVYVIGNHFNSKGSDQPLFGPNQPPTLNSEAQRNQQATLVRNFVQSILAIDPNANVIVAGDLNDFEFSNPLTILENGGLNTLVETLPANERYTYNFQGNAQVLDHILVSNNLLSRLDGFDVVHINSEFASQVSDHDPVLARFNIAAPIVNQAPTAVTLTNLVPTLAENTSTTSRIRVADIAIADDALGTNVLSLSGADASAFEIDGNALFLRVGTLLNFEAKSSYAVTVNVDDATVGNTPDASTNFTLTLTNVNEAPISVDDTATTSDTQAITINVLGNDRDVDAGDVLTIAAFTAPASGTLVQNTNNTFTYTPVLGFAGNTSFTYTIQDAAGLTSTATVAIAVTAGSNSILGTTGNDNLVGTTRNDAIEGLAGNDTLNGAAGADTLIGGVGDDRYIVDASDVIVENPGEGTDLVQASVSFSLAPFANVENLTLTGSANLNATGNALNNVLTGNSGINILTGGAGDDTYIVGTGDTIVELANEGTDLVQSAVTFSIAPFQQVENLTLTGTGAISGTGNDLDNVITGNSANNTLNGEGGNDSLSGGAGNDTLNGGAGNDTLNGGTGSDRMVGGTGDDTYLVNDESDRVIEDADSGIDLVQSSVSWTLGSNVENLTLTGSAALEGIGNSLNNLITGNSGSNELNGGAGDDTLLGGNGNDRLLGGSGNDILIGGAGNDTLIGGTGNDVFVYTAFSDRNDTITDFNTSLDKLDLVALSLGANPIANGFLRFSQSGSNTLVQIDQNGATGGASFSTLATLNNVTASALTVGSNVVI